MIIQPNTGIQIALDHTPTRKTGKEMVKKLAGIWLLSGQITSISSPRPRART